MSKEKQIPAIDYTQLVWNLTDPDNFQYGRKVSPGVFQFKEFDRNNYTTDSENYPSPQVFIDTVFYDQDMFVEDTIVLANFNEDEIRGHISAYYNSLEQLREIYGDDSDFIIAECIFEQQSGLY